MAPEKREWTVPAPLRALMWWPGVAFVLVMIAPDAAAASIAASGAALVALGAVWPIVARRIRRSRPRPSHDDRPTVEMPTIEIERAGR